MAGTNTQYNDNLLMAYFSRRTIKTLHDKVWFYQIPEKFPLPKGSGNTMTFNGFRTLAAASSTLGETSANTAVTLSSRKVAVTIATYGRGVRITDFLEKTSIIPVEPGALRELENSAALTVDNAVQLAVFKNVLLQVGQQADTKTKILSGLMSATVSSFCANTGTSGATSTQFGFPAIFPSSCLLLSAVSSTAPSISARLGPIAVRQAVDRLKNFSVPPMADGKYVGVAHPKALTTMYGNVDWKQWQLNYSGGPQSTMYKNEAGIVHNVRLLESPNCPRFAVAAHSVNLTPIFGMGALAVTELDGGIKMIIKRPGPQSTDNPYDLYSTLSYKVRIVASVLNPSAGCILFTEELI